jgi:hypothetical protein
VQTKDSYLIRSHKAALSIANRFSCSRHWMVAISDNLYSSSIQYLWAHRPYLYHFQAPPRVTISEYSFPKFNYVALCTQGPLVTRALIWASRLSRLAVFYSAVTSLWYFPNGRTGRWTPQEHGYNELYCGWAFNSAVCHTTQTILQFTLGPKDDEHNATHFLNVPIKKSHMTFFYIQEFIHVGIISLWHRRYSWDVEVNDWC